MNTCSICRNEARVDIDRALIGSGPLRTIAVQHGVSKTALIRHRDNCIAEQLTKAKDLSDVAQASTLVKELRDITRKTGAVLARAVRQKNGELALRAIARLERQLELKARLLGSLEERVVAGAPTTVQVVYIDAAPGKKFLPGTQSSHHDFEGRKSNIQKTLDVSTCDPLLTDQNRDSAETDRDENVLNAPRQSGAAENL